MTGKLPITQDLIDSALIGLSLLQSVHSKNKELSSAIFETYSDKEIKAALTLAASQLMLQAEIELNDEELISNLLQKSRNHVLELSLTIGENIE